MQTKIIPLELIMIRLKPEDQRLCKQDKVEIDKRQGERNIMKY